MDKLRGNRAREETRIRCTTQKASGVVPPPPVTFFVASSTSQQQLEVAYLLGPSDRTETAPKWSGGERESSDRPREETRPDPAIFEQFFDYFSVGFHVHEPRNMSSTRRESKNRNKWKKEVEWFGRKKKETEQGWSKAEGAHDSEQNQSRQKRDSSGATKEEKTKRTRES